MINPLIYLVMRSATNKIACRSTGRLTVFARNFSCGVKLYYFVIKETPIFPNNCSFVQMNAETLANLFH